MHLVLKKIKYLVQRFSLREPQGDKVSLSQESISKFMKNHTLVASGNNKNAISITDLAQKVAQHGALPPDQQDDTLLSIMDALELDIKVEQTLTEYNHYGTIPALEMIP